MRVLFWLQGAYGGRVGRYTGLEGFPKREVFLFINFLSLGMCATRVTTLKHTVPYGGGDQLLYTPWAPFAPRLGMLTDVHGRDVVLVNPAFDGLLDLRKRTAYARSWDARQSFLSQR